MNAFTLKLVLKKNMLILFEEKIFTGIRYGTEPGF